MPMQFAEQGYVVDYPHSDFDGPCTCAECCMDIEHGYVPHCFCGKPIAMYGTCKECETKTEHPQHPVNRGY